MYHSIPLFRLSIIQQHRIQIIHAFLQTPKVQILSRHKPKTKVRSQLVFNEIGIFLMVLLQIFCLAGSTHIPASRFIQSRHGKDATLHLRTDVRWFQTLTSSSKTEQNIIMVVILDEGKADQIVLITF